MKSRRREESGGGGTGHPEGSDLKGRYQTFR